MDEWAVARTPRVRQPQPNQRDVARSRGSDGDATNPSTGVTQRASIIAHYPIGKKVSAKEFRELKIERDDFHGDWNYVINRRKRMR